MADRYDQFEKSCSIEIGKTSAASNASELHANRSEGDIIDDNIASQDTAISNASSCNSEPAKKKQRSSSSIMRTPPTHDPPIYVDSNLFEEVKRGRLVNNCYATIPERPLSLHCNDFHLSVTKSNSTQATNIKSKLYA
jgi:hypothetical protein